MTAQADEDDSSLKTRIGEDAEVLHDSGQHLLGPTEPPPVVEPIADPMFVKIAEFEIRNKLGQGGFGSVYLAYDTVLQREVAIKIPNRAISHAKRDTSAYLREARAVASLDHPNILPVYQAASTPELAFFIVTKLIDGTTLGIWNQQHHPTFAQLAGMIAKIAEALAFAHAHQVIHRDVKPGNILVDRQGRPYLADFGLAMREFDPDSKTAYAGTPAYMSPEQVRGEGHRVDGRSDIFSLGVVLYQMLVGHRPFEGIDRIQPPKSIDMRELVDPCRTNPAIPRELGRICQRALAESVTERYQNAGDLALDLYEFMKAHGEVIDDAKLPTRILSGATPSEMAAATVVGSSQTDTQISPVVPKGLRPFESGDSDFFLRLLPGPYDREGLPSSLRFWKTKLESRLPQEAFSVGVVYGPSGCGKTSMFRAGLMPRLDRELISISVEASAIDTETAIRDAIHSTIEIPPRLKQLEGETSPGQDLLHSFTWIRRNTRRKVVICIDQFEQWLFSHSSTLEHAYLTQALRQCDGIHLQVLLMVRDDFWMGISRLMQALNLPIDENHNAAKVDLFDKRHARHVLALFGAAFGQLPLDENQLTPSQNHFLNAAIEYLSIDGRVICVQLALLAEMMKHRAWGDSSLLSQDGGAGLGVNFLEQTFDLETSSRRHQRHTEGAQRVLRRLLPEPGAKIKGAMQSERELLIASGYTDPAAFRELMRLLDSELHLITPTDRSDGDSLTNSSISGAMPTVGDTGYQLTHDFLIAAVRRWLELRQLGTPLGQAQLKLDNFTDLYRARPSHHSLPSLIEYLSIRSRLRPSSWNEPQLRMMTAAKKRHVRSVGKWALILMLSLVTVAFGWHWNQHQQAHQLAQSEVDRLLVATWPEAIEQATALRQKDVAVRGALLSHLANPKLPMSERVRAAIVLSPTLPAARERLLEYLIEAPAHEVVLLCQSAPLPELVDVAQAESLWDSKHDSPTQELRLACLLAQHAPSHPHLLKHPQRVVQLLLSENPLYVNEWMKGFEPIGEALRPVLVTTYQTLATETGSATLNAANLVAKYAAKQPAVLAEILSDSGPTGYRVFVEALRNEPLGKPSLHAALKAAAAPMTPDEYWEPDAQGIDWWNSPSPAVTSARRLAETPDLIQIIETAGGLATDSFVLVQQLETSAFDSLADSLVPYGFRVASICPYMVGGRRLCMATWKKDGRQSVYTMQSTSAELKQLQAEYEMKHYFADDITAYSLDHHETAVYACVWTTTPPLPIVEDSRIYVEVPSEKHQEEGWGPLLKRGFEPRCNVDTMNRQNQESHTSVRWKLKEWVDTRDEWNQPRDEFEQTLKWSPSALLLQARLSTRNSGDPQRGLTVLWWDSLPLESLWIPYQSQADHRRACTAAGAQGFRPFAIHATQSGTDDTPLFCSTWWRPLENLITRSKSIRRQTRLILALHELGDHSPLMAALSSTTDPEQRASVIDGFSRDKVPPLWLAVQLCQADNLVLRRAASHALALYRRGPLTELAEQWLAQHTVSCLQPIEDAGLRSGVIALSRAWNLPTPTWSKASTEFELLTTQNQRMVILSPPDLFWIGSAANEPGRDGGQEKRCPLQLGHRFALSTLEVSVEEYRRFQMSPEYVERYSPSPDCPVNSVTWFEGARYCRWLSEQEGVPESEMCYPPIDKIAPGMTIETHILDRVGYRLPTEPEWEYAAHGGYDAGRHFGFAPELLDHYAWTAQNSGYHCHPVGTRLPNDYGLFDMLGNAMEWCQSRYTPHPWPSSGIEPDPATQSQTIHADDYMDSRGGGVLYQPLDARVSHRDDHPAEIRRVYMSFRIARTVRDPIRKSPNPRSN